MTEQLTFTAVCDSTADQYGWAVQHSSTHDGHTVVLASAAC
jgi:hypothetical protein